MTMRDDFHSAAWAGNHHQLSTAIHKAVRSINHGFEWLSARQFDAPWCEKPRRTSKAGH
jgi:hypothetical protein